MFNWWLDLIQKVNQINRYFNTDNNITIDITEDNNVNYLQNTYAYIIIPDSLFLFSLILIMFGEFIFLSFPTTILTINWIIIIHIVTLPNYYPHIMSINIINNCLY